MKALELIEELKELSKRGNLPVKIADDNNGKYIKNLFIDSYIDSDGEEVYYIKVVPYYTT